ncbi:AraC family transcriptional regulator [Yinghuangia sp. ASG 101]|uniref:helix-turn-helix transcriptional regulator n=1 Tax=Yinghuangia sp. ASG 101 TaxID=2896848 RepID=UPI001E45CD03|nr:AraC family transcriptional regulator [Yinghuangia sp. ASG 101]UGQ12167.1 AraC family transcriptional regulator [Yinghuangia sp. ASG 101]
MLRRDGKESPQNGRARPDHNRARLRAPGDAACAPARPTGGPGCRDHEIRAHPAPRTTALGSVTTHQIGFPAADSGPRLLEAEPGQLALVLSTLGAIRVARAGRELVVRDEAVALCDTDTRLPLAIGPGPGSQAAEAVVMVFPGAAVPTVLPDTGEPRHEVCDAAGPGALLRRFLVEAAARAPGLRPPEAARFGDAALHLAAAVLEWHFADLDRTGGPTRHHELMTRVRGFIDRNLADPDLTPSLVASAHHISVRQLQRLFKVEGSTPSDWIRQRRLDNCRRELCDGALRSVPISEIGLRNGFALPSDFSRVFRARYGVPPGRFRDERLHRDAPG